MRPGWRRLFRLDVGSGRVERDVDDELAFHLAMRERRLIDAGLDPAVARREALQRFGDRAAVRAECVSIDQDRERGVRLTRILETLRQDAAYAWRAVRHHRGFTVVTVLILALGIGANTAIFSVIDALLLRSLPVPHPEQLVAIGDQERTDGLSTGSPRTDLLSYPLYADLRDNTRVVGGLAASGSTDRLDVVFPSDSAAGSRAGDATIEHPHGRFVTGNFFTVLQVTAALGRTFTAEEDGAPGGDPVVVISDGYWRSRFGGDRRIVGRTMVVNGTPLTIIGITPPGFFGDIVGDREDVWLPMMMQPLLMPHSPRLSDRSVSWLLALGRLLPGRAVGEAREELRALAARSMLANVDAAEAGAVHRTVRERPLAVEPGGAGFSPYRGTFAQALFTLMTAVGLVFLVICANVANLMLARGAARGREISIRQALGAGRRRLVQQLLSESVLVAFAGGLLGLLVAQWGSALLLRLASDGANPIPVVLSRDSRILWFCFAASLLTAALCGLAPAVRGTRVDLTAALKGQGRGLAGVAGTPGGVPLGKALVAVQVALSLLLLVSAGMLVRSTARLTRSDIGVARDRLVSVTLDAQRSGYAGRRVAALARDLTDRVAALPGVAAVSVSKNGIFSGFESATTIGVEGFTAVRDADTIVTYDAVGPGYFRAVGANLLLGRDFEAGDDESGPRVAILNATMARFYFPRGDLIGRHVSYRGIAFQIVGVVSDIEEQDLRQAPARRLYLPFYQLPQLPGRLNFEVRSSGDAAPLVAPLRQALRAADPALIVDDLEPLTDLIRDSIARDRLVTQVIGAFGGLALVLAALGLYGVMAYTTVRRTNEFGLRLALGARSVDIVRLVLRDVALLVAGGVILGVPLTFAGTRLLRGQLFNVRVIDPPSIMVALVVLAVSAVLAGLVPALRASRVAPQIALRAD